MIIWTIQNATACIYSVLTPWELYSTKMVALQCNYNLRMTFVNYFFVTAYLFLYIYTRNSIRNTLLRILFYSQLSNGLFYALSNICVCMLDL